MKNPGIHLSVFLLMLVSALSCTDPVASISRIEYRIPSHINLTAGDLNRISGDFKTDPSSAVYIEITLYSYSAGREKISLSGDSEMKTVTSPGRIKALVKVINDKKLLRAEFAEGRGSTKEEMINSLAEDIKRRFQ